MQDRSDSRRAERFIEPIADLARFAYENAPRLCDADHGCEPYHRGWTLVRAVESGGAAPLGEPFLSDWIGRSAQGGRARVLLSGSADTGLMGIALRACAAHRLTPEIVIADQCETPLAQARRFAVHAGVRIETVRGSILDLDIAPVDAIVAHTFISFLPVAARPVLFETWARTLRRGGHLLVSQRFVSPDAMVTQESPEKTAARLDALERSWRDAPLFDLDPGGVRAAAVDLWGLHRQRNHLTEETFRTLAEEAGFGIEMLRRDRSGKNTAPSTFANQAGPRPRVEVALTRR